MEGITLLPFFGGQKQVSGKSSGLTPVHFLSLNRGLSWSGNVRPTRWETAHRGFPARCPFFASFLQSRSEVLSGVRTRCVQARVDLRYHSAVSEAYEVRM
jgi:hypothetical protein